MSANKDPNNLKYQLEIASYSLNEQSTNFKNLNTGRNGQIFKVTTTDNSMVAGYSDFVFISEYWRNFQTIDVSHFSFADLFLEKNENLNENDIIKLLKHNISVAIQNLNDNLQKYINCKNVPSEGNNKFELISNNVNGLNYNFENRDLFSGLDGGDSHFFVNDFSNLNLNHEFFNTHHEVIRLKTKLGANSFYWQQWLDAALEIKNQIINLKTSSTQGLKTKIQILWRLDFNSTLDEITFLEFINLLEKNNFLSDIEFIEDPLPWCESKWNRFNQLIPLAIDFEIDTFLNDQLKNSLKNSSSDNFQFNEKRQNSFSFLVFKPARQQLSEIVNILKNGRAKLVITHMQDSIIGKEFAVSNYFKIKNYTGTDANLLLAKQRLVTSGLGIEKKWTEPDRSSFLNSLKFEKIDLNTAFIKPTIIESDSLFFQFTEKLKQPFFWNSWDSVVLLNPRMPETEKQQLKELSEKYFLPGHIWIASSGSSKKGTDSVKLIAISKMAFLKSAESVNRFLKTQVLALNKINFETKDSATDIIWVQALPFFHVGGFSLYARSFGSNQSVVLGLEKKRTEDEKSYQYVWNVDYFYNTLLKITPNNNACELNVITSLVPTQVYDLIQKQLVAPKCLKAVIVGGSALDIDLLSKARQLGWPLLVSYGMTEVASQIATSKLNSQDLIVLDHHQVKTTQDGLLQIKSNSLMSGWAQYQDGKSYFQSTQDGQWFQTADFVEIKNEKNELIDFQKIQESVLIPKGRSSDFIKIKGEGVNIEQVESSWFLFLEKFISLNSVQDWKSKMLIRAAFHERDGSELVLLIDENLNSADYDWDQWLNDFNKNLKFPLHRIYKKEFVKKIPITALGKKIRF